MSSCAGLYQRLGVYFHVSARIRRHLFAHMGSLTCVCIHFCVLRAERAPASVGLYVYVDMLARVKIQACNYR